MKKIILLSTVMFLFFVEDSNAVRRHGKKANVYGNSYVRNLKKEEPEKEKEEIPFKTEQQNELEQKQYLEKMDLESFNPLVKDENSYNQQKKLKKEMKNLQTFMKSNQYNLNNNTNAKKLTNNNTAPKEFHRLENDANAGNTEAQEMLGLMYLHGFSGVEKNSKKAKMWLLKSAKFNYPRSLLGLGQIFIKEYNVQKACYYFKKAKDMMAPQAEFMFKRYCLNR